jgi:hypothetical protein
VPAGVVHHYVDAPVGLGGAGDERVERSRRDDVRRDGGPRRQRTEATRRLLEARSARRAAITTRQPASARPVATPSPMPRLAPVTMATRHP